MSKNRKSNRKHTQSRRRSKIIRWTVVGFALFAVYIWAFYTFFVSPFSFRWQAIFGEPQYPQDYEIHGIDVSHYQGNIDW